MEHTLVVGGTSDIGVWVVDALAKRGHSISITGRNKKNYLKSKTLPKVNTIF